MHSIPYILLRPPWVSRELGLYDALISSLLNTRALLLSLTWCLGPYWPQALLPQPSLPACVLEHHGLHPSSCLPDHSSQEAWVSCHMSACPSLPVSSWSPVYTAPGPSSEISGCFIPFCPKPPSFQVNDLALPHSEK